MNIQKIKLDTLSADIFSDVALEAAEYITITYTSQGTEKEKEVNKSTQLRKFYDELLMWHDKVLISAQDADAAYRQVAPFIQMMKAKAAYSKGRKHVDEHFTEVFNQIIGQIKDPTTLKHAKLFFEAVLGFRKSIEK